MSVRRHRAKAAWGVAARNAPAVALTVALLIRTTPAASAQDLTGLVFSTEDRAPVAGATVWLLDAEFVTADSAVTDRLGRFTLSRPDTGSWSLVASHAAFLGSSPEQLDLTGAEAGGALLLELTPLPERGAEIRSVERRGQLRVGMVTGTVLDRATGEALEVPRSGSWVRSGAPSVAGTAASSWMKWSRAV